ncbi:uncharacterized protein VTP21DRAFT_3848 [Calcarisporiella thermophila]|uniref:uncharacterized protein n=1 Tax=Calcarisporiella thermophila TaxID=911321 RepID=UPI003743DD13
MHLRHRHKARKFHRHSPKRNAKRVSTGIQVNDKLSVKFHANINGKGGRGHRGTTMTGHSANKERLQEIEHHDNPVPKGGVPKQLEKPSLNIHPASFPGILSPAPNLPASDQTQVGAIPGAFTPTYLPSQPSIAVDPIGESVNKPSQDAIGASSHLSSHNLIPEGVDQTVTGQNLDHTNTAARTAGIMVGSLVTVGLILGLFLHRRFKKLRKISAKSTLKPENEGAATRESASSTIGVAVEDEQQFTGFTPPPPSPQLEPTETLYPWADTPTNHFSFVYVPPDDLVTVPPPMPSKKEKHPSVSIPEDALPPPLPSRHTFPLLQPKEKQDAPQSRCNRPMEVKSLTISSTYPQLPQIVEKRHNVSSVVVTHGFAYSPDSSFRSLKTRMNRLSSPSSLGSMDSSDFHGVLKDILGEELDFSPPPSSPTPTVEQEKENNNAMQEC